MVWLLFQLPVCNKHIHTTSLGMSSYCVYKVEDALLSGTGHYNSTASAVFFAIFCLPRAATNTPLLSKDLLDARTEKLAAGARSYYYW